MEKIQYGNIEGYVFSSFKRIEGVDTLITSKGKNNSADSFSGLNLGLNSGDSISRVELCREQLLNTLGGSQIFPNQTHGDRIGLITQKELLLSKEALDNYLKATDAVITNRPNVWLFILTADCIPIVVYDPVKRVIAAVHAGWRGLKNKIVLKTIDTMQQQFGCQIADLKVAIGPAISKPHYEIGEDVSQHFLMDFPEALEKSSNENKWMLDLVAVCNEMLMQKGVAAASIELSGFCNYCQNDIFYSYRRDGGKTGRMVTGIVLR